MFFSTTTNGSSAAPTDRMTVYHNGNIGIGTTAPGSFLELQKTSTALYDTVSNTVNTPLVRDTTSNSLASAGLTIANSTASNNTGAYIELGVRNASSNIGRAYLGAVSAPGISAPVIVLGQSTGASSYAERVRIDTAGNLGIGTTNPARTLDVSGTARITSDTVISGTVQIAGTGTEGCNSAADKGKIRVNPTNNRMEICRWP